MKRPTFLMISVLASLGGNARSQWVVEDPAVLAQTVINTALGKIQLDLSESMVSRIGDAASLKQVPGLSEVLQSLGSVTTANAGDTSQPCTGKGAMTYSGGNLYQVIGESIPTPDGAAVKRQAQDYKKFEAAHRTASEYLAVIRETEGRRSALLQGIRNTTEAIQSAKDLAQVQKLQAVASAQAAALNAIDGERSTALGTALVQSLDNTTDEGQQTQARKEERAVDFNVALSKADRFFTPIASTVTIPNTRASRR